MKGIDIAKIKKEINDIVIKTLFVAQPSIAHVYKSCQADDTEN